MMMDDFWSDQRRANALIDEMNGFKEQIESFRNLQHLLHTIEETQALLKEGYEEEWHQLLDDEVGHFVEAMNTFEIEILLSKPYDHAFAIVEFHPGAGGTESQDWADMLFRMIVRWCELHRYPMEVLDYQVADDAGIKSASLLIKAHNAFGYLKSERGVHRLVRISPFDASGRRHTSFASIDVMPQVEDAKDIIINDDELRVDTYRSGGAGGQHVNKTDSAVRITHLPTGLVASCQSERSQIQNRERAMTMLKSKLYQRQLDEQEAEMNRVRGVQQSIEWGSQIRSYVFAPYTLVKDHRTDYEEGNVAAVMNGAIDEFIYAYLKKEVR